MGGNVGGGGCGFKAQKQRGPAHSPAQGPGGQGSYPVKRQEGAMQEGGCRFKAQRRQGASAFANAGQRVWAKNLKPSACGSILGMLWPTAVWNNSGRVVIPHYCDEDGEGEGIGRDIGCCLLTWAPLLSLLLLPPLPSPSLSPPYLSILG